MTSCFMVLNLWVVYLFLLDRYVASWQRNLSDRHHRTRDAFIFPDNCTWRREKLQLRHPSTRNIKNIDSDRKNRHNQCYTNNLVVFDTERLHLIDSLQIKPPKAFFVWVHVSEKSLQWVSQSWRFSFLKSNLD